MIGRPPLRLLLAGFGSVGREVARLLGPDRVRHPGLARLEVRVAGILTGRHGSLLPEGDGAVDLPEALGIFAARGRFGPGDPGFRGIDTGLAAREASYDVLVELTPNDPAGRGEPALSWIREALDRGRHVVTANKGPIAFAGAELAALAAARGVRLLHEATVMDGAPIFSLARGGLRSCRVGAISGLLNSTTTLVLSRIEEGLDAPAAVAEAQRLGIAEADPGRDLDGWDAAAKIAILANIFMGASITPLDVEREGISGLGAAAIREAARGGTPIRLLARAWTEGEAVRARVAPAAIPAEDPFAAIRGTGAGVRIETDLMGPILLMHENPTVTDTACGVLSDLLEIARGNGS